LAALVAVTAVSLHLVLVFRDTCYWLIALSDCWITVWSRLLQKFLKYITLIA